MEGQQEGEQACEPELQALGNNHFVTEFQVLGYQNRPLSVVGTGPIIYCLL